MDVGAGAGPSRAANASIFAALRMLGFGASTLVVAEADAQARMLPESLSECLERCDGPTIVCAQAGNVNTGAFDCPYQKVHLVEFGNGEGF